MNSLWASLNRAFQHSKIMAEVPEYPASSILFVGLRYLCSLSEQQGSGLQEGVALQKTQRQSHGGSFWYLVTRRHKGLGSVVKSAFHRNAIVAKEKVTIFEMEGSGVRYKFLTVVIKGICGYVDSNKTNKWQRCAAATAASESRRRSFASTRSNP
jgi:hypothetical protein